MPKKVFRETILSFWAPPGGSPDPRAPPGTSRDPPGSDLGSPRERFGTRFSGSGAPLGPFWTLFWSSCARMSMSVLKSPCFHVAPWRCPPSPGGPRRSRRSPRRGFGGSPVTSGGHGVAPGCSRDDEFNFLRRALAEAFPVLKPGGVPWTNTSTSYLPAAPWNFVVGALPESIQALTHTCLKGVLMLSTDCIAIHRWPCWVPPSYHGPRSSPWVPHWSLDPEWPGILSQGAPGILPGIWGGS